MTTPPPGGYQPPGPHVTLGPNGQPVQAAYGSPHAHPLNGPAWTPDPYADDNPFSSVFDFSFTRWATPGVVKIVYIATFVVLVLVYVGSVIAAFVRYMPDVTYEGVVLQHGTPLPGLVVLVVGWIPTLYLIIVSRVGLEAVLAVVRTAIDARALRAKFTP